MCCRVLCLQGQARALPLLDGVTNINPHHIFTCIIQLDSKCHVGSRLGLRSLPRRGLCSLSFKVRTIQFLHRPILSSLKN